ncbi:hypothetical protein [Pontibacter sp. G13]|uniref:hypothetical protein n=1 Tax=Pontibacter sp. G13 TaxID=3074898 RepID=UPI00288C515F|nr:hypothetical protein [Pontibacter sp. G13]WNJ19168.1 hypothetical protein RJD25_01640 [Pontibacter sp. G13]
MMVFPYPWNGLEEYLVEKSGGVLNLFSYGSLMNAYSSAVTLSEGGGMYPAIGYGFKRVFNYPMGAHAYERYGDPHAPDATAALNAIPAADASSQINGLIKAIPLSDLENLRNREVNYELHEIVCTDWDTRRRIMDRVFVLSFADGASDIFPHPTYLQVCLEGANAISENFGYMFLTSTYLFDGTTTLDHWMKKTSEYHGNQL